MAFYFNIFKKYFFSNSLATIGKKVEEQHSAVNDKTTCAINQK